MLSPSVIKLFVDTKLSNVDEYEIEFRVGKYFQYYKNGIDVSLFNFINTELSKKYPNEVYNSIDYILYNNDKVTFTDQNVVVLNKKCIQNKDIKLHNNLGIRLSISKETIKNNINDINIIQKLKCYYENSSETKVIRKKSRIKYIDRQNSLYYDLTIVNNSIYEIEIEYYSTKLDSQIITESLNIGYNQIINFVNTFKR
tara:strand:- start:524 stop:1120 length:597 start_codon:yes stop_codon:yes gene_type:complete